MWMSMKDNGEDAMNAYLHAHLKSQTSSYLNTAPVLQLSKTVSLQQDHSQPLAVRPKGRPHIPQAQSSVRSGNLCLQCHMHHLLTGLKCGGMSLEPDPQRCTSRTSAVDLTRESAYPHA